MAHDLAICVSVESRCLTLSICVARIIAILGIAIAGCGILSGCVTAPLVETQYFSKSFAAVDTAGQPLLDDLSIAERREGQERAIAGAQVQGGLKKGTNPGCTANAAPWIVVPPSGGFINEFCLADAAYYSSISEPPATLAFRKSLSVVQQYSDLLMSLSDGSSATANSVQIGMLEGNVSQLLQLVPGLGASSGAITSALSGMSPILNQALKAQSASEERRLVRQAAPFIGRLIEGLRGAAPPIFAILIEQSEQNLTSAVDRNSPANTETDLKKIETYRIAVADYVVLLGELTTAWDMLVQAANAPPSAPRLADMAAASADVLADAQAVQKTLAQLRQTNPPPK